MVDAKQVGVIGDQDVSRRQAHGRGVRISRLYTQAGRDPFADVLWETRTARITNPDGTVVFEMKDVEAPASWSQTAVDIAASKYFRKRGVPGTGRETSVRAMVARVADAIVAAGKRFGGYFAGEEDAQALRDELCYMLVHQIGAFNSPVWFNCGLAESYGIKGDDSGNWCWDPATDQVVRTADAYTRPAISACFIVTVQDDLMDIAEHVKREMRIFRFGGGSGGNYSNLRGEGEPLSGGGASSGVMSFLDVFDKSAGAIKSGGTCLAPYQKVYTERGPVAVKDLAESGKDFIVLSYDPPAKRYKAKTARAWMAGRKKVVRITTDKGQFDLTFDHPVKLASEETVLAGNLRAGQALFACSVDFDSGTGKYLRVGLRDGMKGRMRLSRLIAQDVMGLEVAGWSIHHKDENTLNNHPDNLERKLQGDHARDHAADYVESGTHPFQVGRFSHAGDENGMHSSAEFWQDEARSGAYREKQGRILRDSGRAATMQVAAAAQKMLNVGYRLINAGHDISTFDAYWEARKATMGKIGNSKADLLGKFEAHFGSYEGFVKELLGNNHRVTSVEDVGVMDVYDVEVDCPTPDDKSPESGHNFVVWPTSDYIGSGVVIFNTRRAAKMVVLDADHPDIEKFVEWKVREEDKVRALIAAGWSSDFNGDAYRTIGGQNANNSVSVTDEFMKSVVADGDWDLTWRRDGKVARTVKAKGLFRKIAEAAWKCADPGLQFSSTMNRWHTIPASGPIRASNPCSEYLSIDDTSCNLASLNLMKFMRFDGGKPSFDCRAYEHACRSFIVAMDILVDHASYPTQEIAQNTHDYRQLGLGYANLGAAVMAQGLPYDSPGARSFAAAVTAVMSGTAYATSADLAASKGAFAGHAKNAGHMRKVMYMHRDAAHAIKAEGPAAAEVVSRAATCWAEAVSRGEHAGYRNAQTVVIAPTGTIGLLMDCDTTGVEPDFALVKGKKLAGGGYMKITNGSVDRALETLGYAGAARKAVTDHVLEHGTIEGAPGVDPAHYPAFDCAVSPKQDGRAITPMGHVRMVAAVQPFLSGSASKTVNMPESTTVEEIEQIYLESWKLGLKCVSVYRDNCKASQPLAAAGKKDEKKDEHKAEAKAPEPKAQAAPRTERRRLPKKRYGFTQEARIAGHKVYVRTGEYEDGALGEIFVDTAKDGAAFRSLMNSFAIAVSIGLQHGVPLDEFVNVFTFTKFEPSGPVSDHPNIKNATSIVDFIFRLLALEYLGRTDLVQVPPEEQERDVGDVAEKIPHAPTEKAKAAMKVVEAVKEAVKDAPASAIAAAYQSAYRSVVNGKNGNGNGNGKHGPKQSGSEFCSNCGGMTVRTGTCTTCLTCGTAGGCG